ncbi:hypothetical protein FJZ20_00800 [Candidatus Pacearchaeota archaeon]|nr:hypothetical protein [Candidatus Pacearchaeota archaeon]
MEERPKIILPQDEFRRKALENKLKEYKIRLDKIREVYSFTRPQIIRRISIQSGGLGYKIDILEHLLEEKELDLQKFSLELGAKDEFFDEKNYKIATDIIDDYCRTGGQNLRGGTGLSVNLS